MKKVISVLLALIMTLSCFFCVNVFADEGIKVIINKKALTMDQMPVIVNGRTLVPLRAIFEALGATVGWDDATKTATGVLDDTTVSLQIDNTNAKVNGKDVTLDVPAQIVGSRTLVPVRFISESLGCKVDWDGATKTVIIESAKDAIFNLTFDNLSSFENNKDFITGAAYDEKGLSLTNEYDHTLGSGKSLKMDNRTKNEHRVKFLNALANAKKGETYIISAFIYATDGAEKVRIGAYSDTGTSNAYTPIAKKDYDILANQWTLVEVEYTHKNDEISQIGIDQYAVDAKCAPTLYIDDVKVVKKASEVVVTPEKTTLIPVTQREGKRPTPLVTGIGKTYDDLIFYDRVFEAAGEKKDSETMFNALPKNPKVMADNDDMLASKLSGIKTSYAKVEKVSVEGMPFTEALKAKVKEVPESPYHTQMVLESLGDDTYEDGDNMLIIFYLRTLSVENESAMGQVQLVVEQEVPPNNKVLQENVKTVAGAGWKKVYLPFVAQKGYTRLCIRLGYYVQEVEFGGYQILNYGKNVKFEDLPSDTVMEIYDKKELFEKDVDWRKEAWARIEEIRRGDIKVIVKDENGNVVPDADVKIDMYDHEFKWGTAFNGTAFYESEKGEKYREAVSTLFNTVVSEIAHKPAEYLKNPEPAKKQVEFAKQLGMKHFRGHALVWDRPIGKTFDAEKDEWIENTSVTEELARLIIANDEAGIDKYIEESIKKMAGDFNGQLCDWDVVNELLVNNEIRSRFGNQVLNKWFEWAQKYDTTAKMYINETSIIGQPSNNKLKSFKVVLDYMVQNGVDFDGIGMQGHFGTFVSPKGFYDELMELTEYGKEIKITEFDCAFDMNAQDPEAEASFTRDIMILAYSMQQMDGFLMWGFWDGSHWLKNAPVFDDDWSLKESGKQYIDLVYNKWWTQEDGKTAADGTYATKGYYGDYLITASKDGKTATADVKCYKGNDNTIEIVLK
ncbi:MAG: hypothetical protein E7391_04700 [Ruminococcaceae bacterium]|nr:hypothetical protein [Oscillospiraceae bacterium]